MRRGIQHCRPHLGPCKALQFGIHGCNLTWNQPSVYLWLRSFTYPESIGTIQCFLADHCQVEGLPISFCGRFHIAPWYEEWSLKFQSVDARSGWEISTLPRIIIISFGCECGDHWTRLWYSNQVKSRYNCKEEIIVSFVNNLAKPSPLYITSSLVIYLARDDLEIIWNPVSLQPAFCSSKEESHIAPSGAPLIWILCHWQGRNSRSVGRANGANLWNEMLSWLGQRCGSVVLLYLDVAISEDRQHGYRTVLVPES